MATQLATQAVTHYSSSADRSLAELRVVKDVIAPKCNDIELQFFLAVCQRTGLDPFARQIYAIVRGEGDRRKLTIQTSIDGYRAIAERSGKYAGQLAPQWCDADGVWVDVWLKSIAPSAARVGVLRSDWQQPVWGIARFAAYQQESNPLWKKMPDAMLAKCAEALALRKAFPDAIGGVYTREEMEQADNEYAPMVDAEPVVRRVPAQPAHLPEVTPIHPVVPHDDPATAPASSSSTQPVTIKLCYDYAKNERGFDGAAWARFKSAFGNDVGEMWASLHSTPIRMFPVSTEEDLDEEDAALAKMAGLGEDEDAQEALAEFQDVFADADTAPTEPTSDISAQAWTDLQRRMSALGWTVEHQETFITEHAVHSDPGDYGPGDWHAINEALQEKEAEASQAEQYDLRKLPTGRAGKGRH